MGNSRHPFPLGLDQYKSLLSARTPGPLGYQDQADPSVTTRLGDTPGPLGFNDHGDPALQRVSDSSMGSNQPRRLGDRTPISTRSSGMPDGTDCPVLLSTRSNADAQDINWEFISAREGGQRLTGYVPHADGSNSGITIATGIDLGTRNASDIEKLNITTDLKQRLKPYSGKKGIIAQRYLQDKALVITEDDASSLDRAVKQAIVKNLIEKYNLAVRVSILKDNCPRQRFEQLPQSVQTAIASISFQYGSLETKTPRFWQQITEQRWQAAIDNLKNFGDAYPSRRKLEADLIDHAIRATPFRRES